ncbi:MAG: SCO family protein [Wenzhouxiangellaceae bacterium]
MTDHHFISSLRNDGLRPPRAAGRLWLPVALSLVAALLVFWIARGTHTPEPEWQAASLFPEPLPVAEFSLVDAEGAPFTGKDLHGRITLLFFGFANCPDICPVTLDVLARALEQLRLMRTEPLPQVVFVSVDPERDRPALLREYVAQFDPAIRAVTGTDPELQQLTKALGVYFRRGEPDEHGFYTVDHSGMIAIIDPDGRMIGRFPPGAQAQQIASDLFRLHRELKVGQE